MLLRYILIPLLPPRGVEYKLRVPGEGIVRIGYRETLGWSSLLYGLFERDELEFVSRYLRPGEVVMDAGANVGLFSVVMGRAVGRNGAVFAFDPVPTNIARLRANLKENGIDASGVFEVALGSANGQMDLKMSDDTAYASIQVVQSGFDNGLTIPVKVKKLDDVWEELRRPPVSFLKMDVEGAEVEVITGSRGMLAACHPTLLVEANTSQHLAMLKAALEPFGYRHIHPEGFQDHNHLFVCPAHMGMMADTRAEHK